MNKHEKNKLIFKLKKTIEIMQNEIDDLKVECFEDENQSNRIEEIEEQVKVAEMFLEEIHAPKMEILDKVFKVKN